MIADKQIEFHLPAPPVSDDTPLVPARMVNEFVYCPRLAYAGETSLHYDEAAHTNSSLGINYGK
jgi:CRISPR-associated exonuclease Cas4/CRISPR-associated protein Cas1